MPVTISRLSGSVLGLDISTKTGIVVLEKSKCVYASEFDISEVKGNTDLLTRILRMNRLYDEVKRVVQAYKPTLAVLEGYGYANAHTLSILVELGAVVRACLYTYRTSQVEVAPTTMKKFVTGVGNVEKDQVRLWVYKRWGYEHKSNNIIDAYGLARIGLAMKGQAKMTAPEREIVSKLTPLVVDKR